AGPIALADGRVLLAQGAAVRRLTASGAPDPAFGTDGTTILSSEVSALALDGERVLAAFPTVDVATLGPDGALQGGVNGIAGDASDTVVLGLRAVGDRIVMHGIGRYPAAGSRRGTLVDGAFVAELPSGDFERVPLGPAAIDEDGSVVVVGPGGRVRRYTTDGQQVPGLRATLPPAPGNVRFLRQVVGFGPGGRIVAGAITSGTLLPTATFAALRDGAIDRAFGGAPLLKLRGRSVRLERRVIPVRVHCADDAQRRCVVRATAGSSTVRAFVAPGGDRRLRVPVRRSLARAIRRAGRREVRLRLSVIEEAQRVQEESVSLVVRR
ncbi:MAG: hypothetical protein QOI73_2896, partial [Solirubrobacteraceae bacterium]|nr:hypothetical protein [Solirubrobacteraceae bacterium]